MNGKNAYCMHQLRVRQISNQDIALNNLDSMQNARQAERHSTSRMRISNTANILVGFDSLGQIHPALPL